MSKPVPFSHLHVHTEYSLLDGACRVDQLANRVKELGMESIAVTDHGVMTGLYKLQAAADKAGIKPIFGCELYFTEEREVKDPNNRYYHLTALAETTQGLHNLYKMNLRAAQEGMYYGKPRVDYELLKEYGEGVIILSGCLAGRTMQSLANSDLEPDLKKRMHGARDELIRLQDCVGKENVYVEVQNSGVKDWDGSQWEWNAQLQTLANDLGLLTVGTSDTHYLTADMAKGPREGDPWYHDTLLCVQTRALKDQPLDKRMSLIHDWNNPHYYHLRNIEEMKKDLENVPESIPNTLIVAERCNAEIKTGRTFEMLPDFPVPEDYKTPAGQPDGMDEKIWRQQSFLRDKIWEGLHRRYGSPLPAEVVERAEYELEVINKMGTTSYFLITWDWIRYAKEIGMVIGPGRGCFVPETQVWTPEGYKQIADMQAGDTILDENGQLGQVRKQFEYQVDEEMVYIKHHYGDEAGLTVTVDHKILVEPGALDESGEWAMPTGKTQWMPARDIQPGDLVAVAMPHLEGSKQYLGNKVMEITGMSQQELLDSLTHGDRTLRTHHAELAYCVRTLLWAEGAPSSLSLGQDGFYHVTRGDWDQDGYGVGARCGDYMMLRVTEAGRIHYQGPVYDLAIEDPNPPSYTTSSCIVHNSGAGSIVLYALDVTQLCPLEHKLLFERFLSPDRISMPDVDTDAAPVGEANYDMVRQYLRDKYGEENCAQIITFQTIGGKAGIRAAARAFGPELLPLADRLAKAVPMDGAVPVPLTQALEEGVEFKQALAGGGAEAQKIIDNALWMEGLISAESVHAAAFVISPIPLTDALPVQLNKDGHPVTAFAMGEAESVGCLKLDLLGLRNLSILADAQRLIKKYQDVDVDAVNYQVPMDDAKTFEMLARGESVGVFQFECLAGDTIINGEVRTTIADMYKKPPKNLLSVDLGDGVRRRNKVLAVVQSGEKQLYRLNTSSGYTLRASADHKILTADGWKPLSAVTSEDKVVINTKDASRIGCCTECGKQTKSRSGHCHACANIARDSGRVAAANRDPEKWKASLPRGEDHPWWGKAPPQAGRMFTSSDLPYPVRSHWEADFIRAMVAVKEEFEYEPKTFEFKDGSSYTPDFYLPSRDLWVEIACKGGKSGKGKKKIDKFLKEYPGENLTVIRGHQIAEFELANPKLAKWSCPTLPKNFDFDQVISVTPDQVEMTYDIAMEAPLNNYIANGIVVHNSGGMQDTLRAIGTTEFNDLVAIVAAYRPGAMDQIPIYARRKKGLEPVTYGDPRMEPILEETYSLILYQEQSMLLARDLAGFTGGLMDTLRKAIGKKLMDKMMELKPIFFNGTTVEKDGETIEVPGCLKNGVDKKTAELVWEVFEASANYSFNKSHAAAYALISYVTAYLKANYPTEYMAALLTSVMHTKDKVPFYLYETKRMGIDVLPPSVNESFSQFEPSGENAIRFGLTAVKGVGEGIVEAIVVAREQDGLFKNLWDFAQRVDGVNRREVDNLIKAGAFDFSGDTRKGMLEASESLLKQAKKTRQKKSEGQDSLFDAMGSAEAELAAMEVSDAPSFSKDEFTETEKFALEREVAGLYVSGHPLEGARAAWERVRHLGVGEINEEHLSDNPDHPNVVTVAGIITAKRAVYTKRDNKRMLIIQLEDLTGTAEIVVFPKLVEEGMEQYLNEGQMAYLRVGIEEDTRGFGSDDDSSKQIKLLAKLAGPFNPDAIEVPEYYDLQLPHLALNAEMMNTLMETLRRHPGDQSVRLILLDENGEESQTYVFPEEVQVSPSEKLGEELRQAAGLD